MSRPPESCCPKTAPLILKESLCFLGYHDIFHEARQTQEILLSLHTDPQ